MSTKTQETENYTGPLSLALQLIDSRKSSYVMDGAGAPDDFSDVDTTAAISFPSVRVIPNVSRVKKIVKGKSGAKDTFYYTKIRYIQGCHILDMEEQKKQKIEPNHLADKLVFRNGNFTAFREGDLAKFEYLRICEYNANAPEDVRPEDAQPIFRVLDYEQDAGKAEDLMDRQNEAYAKLSSYKTKGAGGKWEYNEDALEFLSRLFGLPIFDSGYSSEAFVALATIAMDEPDRFLNSIADSRSLYEAEVLEAIARGVISIDRGRALYTDGNKVITSFDEVLGEDRGTQAVIDFMSNPKNHLAYEQMRVALRNKKMSGDDIRK